jgi:hypothetical protein
MRTLFCSTFLAALLALSAAAQPPRVGGLALDAPPAMSGNCQAGTHVHFRGRINATGPLVVTYEWLRSDHATSPVRTLRFTRPGPLTITNDWVVRGSASGWMAFRILSPRQNESRKVEFRVNCR